MRRTWILWLIPVAVVSLAACGGGGGETPSGDCAADADCSDGNACNGLETCVDGACTAGTSADDGTQCQVENQVGFCATGACSVSTCGDGIVDESAGEECDDANGDDTDGCTADCLFTCAADADCHDGQVCNGAELCDTASHTCIAGVGVADGTVCTVEGDTSAHFCFGGQCLPNTCGDGYVGGGEACDDGNIEGGDGCEADCTWTCSAAVHCDDGNPCNGVESCEAHLCVAGTPLSEGAICDTGKECLGGACTTAACGDGTLNNGEECDDGNTVGGDGCEADCTWTCAVDADCDDGTVCNGTETCGPDHLCVGEPALDCDDADPCTADSCDAVLGCAHVLIDADNDGVYCGTDCDDTSKAAGAPQTWYRDCDADGYAAASAASLVACTEPAPANTVCDGWTVTDPAVAADCRDTNDQVNPGAGFHDVPYQIPYPCGTGLCSRDSWDWNCDGVDEIRYTETGVFTTASCSLTDLGYGVILCMGDYGWTSSGSPPACGLEAEYTRCEGTLSCGRNTAYRVQECR